MATALRGHCLFGGAFDPPHRTHRRIAEAAAAALPVERIVVLPCREHPLAKSPRASPAHRLQMCELAFAGMPRVEVSDLELERQGPSFTIDTVEAYAEAHRGPLYWLVGSDNLPQLPRWHRWRDLLDRVVLVTVPRTGFPADADTLAQLGLSPALRQRILDHVLPLDPLSTSSTEVRERLAHDGMAPDLDPAVARYVTAHGLYRG
jgi:nicotinate-nucleotide adenylyltransferase